MSGYSEDIPQKTKPELDDDPLRSKTAVIEKAPIQDFEESCYMRKL